MMGKRLKSFTPSSKKEFFSPLSKSKIENGKSDSVQFSFIQTKIHDNKVFIEVRRQAKDSTLDLLAQIESSISPSKSKSLKKEKTPKKQISPKVAKAESPSK